MAAAANIKIMKTYVVLLSLFLSLKTCKDNSYFEKHDNFVAATKNVYIQHFMRTIRLDGMTMTFLKKRKTPSITDYKASTF